MPTPERDRHYRRGPLRITVPSRNDPFLRSLVEGIGGPLGRRTEPGVIKPGFWRVERVLLVIVFIFGILAVLSKDVCRQTGWGSQSTYTGMCYSDWTALYGARGFAENPWAPFTANAAEPFEYPALMSAVASLTAALVPRDLGSGAQLLFYFDINAFLVVLLWAVVVIAVAKSSGRRVWDAALVAASPAILMAATVNWDMWAVAFLALGLLAFGRGHPWLAGVLIGLGAATKLYPVLALGAFLVLAIRTGVWKPFFAVTGGAVIAWVAVNLPFALAAPARWAAFYTFSQSRGAGNSSVWQAWDLSVGKVIPSLHTTPGMITVLGFGLFAAACVGVLALGVWAPRPPRVASLVFLIVAAFVLVGKVYSPQFILWLIPLAALAYPRWRALLTWQLFEVAHFAAIWFFLYMNSGDENAKGRFPEWIFVALVLAHMVALTWIMALVVRSIIYPHTDPVRRVGMDDPLGGLFAGRDAYQGGMGSARTAWDSGRTAVSGPVPDAALVTSGAPAAADSAAGDSTPDRPAPEPSHPDHPGSEVSAPERAAGHAPRPSGRRALRPDAEASESKETPQD